MLNDLVKVAHKLDNLGLRKEATELNEIIRKIASNEDEKAEFAAMQREMRERALSRQTSSQTQPRLTEAEQVALDAKRWREQQELEAEDPETKLIERAITEAKRFARMKHQLFLTKRQSGQDHEDTKRLHAKLAEQKNVLDSILDDAAKIGKMCRYSTFKTIQDTLAEPVVHRTQPVEDYKAPEKKLMGSKILNKSRRKEPAAPSVLPRFKP